MADQNEMTQGAPTGPKPEEKLPSDTSQTPTTADDFRSAANALADEYRGKVDEVWSHANDRVRQHPTKAVLSAIGIGFVLGLIFGR
jgi:ElaB/YqjD/DUF883 family membrane-anchored ribosome-binding protein